MPLKTCFVSDLHFFCQRSVAPQHTSELRLAAGRSDRFVFGGDIFDFKWSQIGSFDRSIAAARNWVEEFIHPFPNCHFDYILGNHDCCPEFVEQLEQISNSCGNFHWHPYTLRIADSIFLHGDVIDVDPSQTSLEQSREKWSTKKPKGTAPNIAYNLLIASRMHRVAGRIMNPAPKVAKQIALYLESIDQHSGIGDVYFGHTHWRMKKEFNGVRFHNGGAPIKGLPFRIIETEIEW